MRFFYAIWPDSIVREKLTSVSTQITDGKIVSPENLHLTLLFLGEVNEDLQDVLEASTNNICGNQFTLNLSQYGTFTRSGVLWMAPSSTPKELSNLVNKLSELALRNHIIKEERPYRPHVTLARKINAQMQLKSLNISWPVREFCLVESKTLPEGANYRVLRTWPLT